MIMPTLLQKEFAFKYFPFLTFLIKLLHVIRVCVSLKSLILSCAEQNLKSARVSLRLTLFDRMTSVF